MATRNTRASKTTKTPVAEAIEVETTAIPEQPSFSWNAYMDALKAQVPDNWKRHTIAIISGLIVSVGIGYVVGWAAITMMVGAAALGMGAFMQALIYVLGMIISMYVGYKASNIVYVNVMDHSIDKACARTYARMRGMFTPVPKGETA